MLDTTVASLLFSGLPLADLYRPEAAGRVVALSFQAEGELLSGAAESKWGPRRRAALEKFIAERVVVYPDAQVVRTWAGLRARLRQAGRTVETADLWIAAVAVAKDAVLLSHDAVFRQVPVCGWCAMPRRDARAGRMPSWNSRQGRFLPGIPTGKVEVSYFFYDARGQRTHLLNPRGYSTYWR